MVQLATEPMRWFWAPPIKKPIIKGRALVLACATTGQLSLGSVCCRCAKPNAKLRSLRVVETSKADAFLSGAEMLTGPAGHLVAGIRLLTQPKVMVPCCSACRALHRWGIAAGLAIILAGVGLFVGFALRDQTAKLATPVWVDFTVIVGGFALVAIGGAVSSLFDWRSLAVCVYRIHDGQLYYEFWSDKYYDFLKVDRVPQQRAGALKQLA